MAFRSRVRFPDSVKVFGEKLGSKSIIYRVMRPVIASLKKPAISAGRSGEHASCGGRSAQIGEHLFGTLKRRLDGGRFLVGGLPMVKTEMALAVTAYDLPRATNVLGVPGCARRWPPELNNKKGHLT